jgi:hypothetical protein
MAEFAFWGERVRLRFYREGRFLGAGCPVAWGLPGAARSVGVAPSRHPGRYPEPEDSTLSHPALEPLTEHHAFSTGLFNRGRLARLGEHPRGQTDIVRAFIAGN